MDATQRRVQLIRSIEEDKITQAQAIEEIHNLEETYGQDAFIHYPITKREKPWTKEYLKYLHTLGNAGACSKEYILHLLEVREEVKRKNRQKVLAITGIIAVCIAVGALLVHFFSTSR